MFFHTSSLEASDQCESTAGTTRPSAPPASVFPQCVQHPELLPYENQIREKQNCHDRIERLIISFWMQTVQAIDHLEKKSSDYC